MELVREVIGIAVCGAGNVSNVAYHKSSSACSSHVCCKWSEVGAQMLAPLKIWSGFARQYVVCAGEPELGFLSE